MILMIMSYLTSYLLIGLIVGPLGTWLWMTIFYAKIGRFPYFEWGVLGEVIVSIFMWPLAVLFWIYGCVQLCRGKYRYY